MTTPASARGARWAHLDLRDATSMEEVAARLAEAVDRAAASSGAERTAPRAA